MMNRYRMPRGERRRCEKVVLRTGVGETVDKADGCLLSLRSGGEAEVVSLVVRVVVGGESKL